MIMDILIRTAEIFGGFAIEFIKLFLLMFFVLKYKLQSVKWVSVYSSAAAVILVISAVTGISQIAPVHTYVCILLVILILKGRYRILYTAAVYIGICIFDMLAATVWLMLSGISYDALAESKHLGLVVNSVSVIFIIILVLVLKVVPYNKNKYIAEKGNRFYLIMLILGELSLLDFITVFQVGKNSADSTKTMAVSLSVGSVMFLLIGIIMLMNYMSKNHYKNISEINDKLIKSQEQYYLMLLQKDEETKRFRHDIKNHINCMYMLFKSGDYNGLENYFDKMGVTLSELSAKIQTGNNMVNAILNDISERYSNVSFSADGKFPDRMKLSGTDICTLFYNLFDNAFAAADKSEGKNVKIFIKTLGGNLFVSVINTVQHRVEIIDNKLCTEKSDKLHHGYGTVNAQICAEQNGGTLTFKCSDTFFEAELIIPNA